MSRLDTISNPDDSRKSFFNRAAWYSVLTPIATAVVTFSLYCLSSYTHFLSRDFFTQYLVFAFCIQIISLVLGLVSLFGIPRHGARIILWKAVSGILASCAMGFAIFVFIIADAIGRGC